MPDPRRGFRERLSWNGFLAAAVVASRAIGVSSIRGVVPVSEKPDLSATLPPPTRLRRTAIISFVWGEQPFHVVCAACSLRRAPDPDSGEPIDWLHCRGFQGGPHVPVNPTGSVPTQSYLIPAKYVMRITYGGRFRITQENESGDLGVFGAKHPAPDAALPLDQIRDIIEGLQVQPGVPEPLVYNNYVRDVSERFEQALARIRTGQNFEYGSEFEIAICKTLRAVLPQKYGICRGYVVSALGEKAGDDVIVYDRMRFPTLRALETDDFASKEQVPIEAVYAYIEAKHSIWFEGDGGASFQKALTQVGQVKMLCDRRQSVPLFECDLNEKKDGPPVGWPEKRNPAYGIILCRHVRIRDGGPIVQDPKEILRHSLAAKAVTLVPPDFCVFGKNNMFIPVVDGVGTDGGTVMPSPFFQSGTSSMNASVVDGVGFGAGLSLLLWALDWIHLGEMPWPAIIEDCIPQSRIPLD